LRRLDVLSIGMQRQALVATKLLPNAAWRAFL
jgi:hypothetical protein